MSTCTGGRTRTGRWVLRAGCRLVRGRETDSGRHDADADSVHLLRALPRRAALQALRELQEGLEAKEGDKRKALRGLKKARLELDLVSEELAQLQVREETACGAACLVVEACCHGCRAPWPPPDICRSPLPPAT